MPFKDGDYVAVQRFLGVPKSNFIPHSACKNLVGVDWELRLSAVNLTEIQHLVLPLLRALLASSRQIEKWLACARRSCVPALAVPSSSQATPSMLTTWLQTLRNSAWVPRKDNTFIALSSGDFLLDQIREDARDVVVKFSQQLCGITLPTKKVLPPAASLTPPPTTVRYKSVRSHTLLKS